MKSMLHMLELRDYDERLLASKCCADKKNGTRLNTHGNRHHSGIGSA